MRSMRHLIRQMEEFSRKYDELLTVMAREHGTRKEQFIYLRKPLLASLALVVGSSIANRLVLSYQSDGLLRTAEEYQRIDRRLTGGNFATNLAFSSYRTLAAYVATFALFNIGISTIWLRERFLRRRRYREILDRRSSRNAASVPQSAR